MARAIRSALPQCHVQVISRRRFFDAFFRLAFPPRLALALGRRFAAFFLAFDRAGLRFFAGFGVGAAMGSRIIGEGEGGVGGAGGYIGSIIPEPGQLLSEKSVGSSIG
jgi:hypothetical protein